MPGEGQASIEWKAGTRRTAPTLNSGFGQADDRRGRRGDTLSTAG